MSLGVLIIAVLAISSASFTGECSGLNIVYCTIDLVLGIPSEIAEEFAYFKMQKCIDEIGDLPQLIADAIKLIKDKGAMAITEVVVDVINLVSRGYFDCYEGRQEFVAVYNKILRIVNNPKQFLTDLLPRIYTLIGRVSVDIIGIVNGFKYGNWEKSGIEIGDIIYSIISIY